MRRISFIYIYCFESKFFFKRQRPKYTVGFVRMTVLYNLIKCWLLLLFYNQPWCCRLEFMVQMHYGFNIFLCNFLNCARRAGSRFESMVPTTVAYLFSRSSRTLCVLHARVLKCFSLPDFIIAHVMFWKWNYVSLLLKSQKWHFIGLFYEFSPFR